MTKRAHHFLAFPLKRRDTENDGTMPQGVVVESSMPRVAAQIWDMLRYDRCHPISNMPPGWCVVVQPWVDGLQGGFTHERWQSFGVRGILLTAVDTDTRFIPSALLVMIRKHDDANAEAQRRVDAARAEIKVVEGPYEHS